MANQHFINLTRSNTIVEKNLFRSPNKYLLFDVTVNTSYWLPLTHYVTTVFAEYVSRPWTLPYTALYDSPDTSINTLYVTLCWTTVVSMAVRSHYKSEFSQITSIHSHKSQNMPISYRNSGSMFGTQTSNVSRCLLK